MKRRFIRIAALSAVFVQLLVAAPAYADNEVRVLVIASSPGDEVASHLVNELIALGITAIVTPSLEGRLSVLAEEQRVSAAVRVMPSRKSVKLWVTPSKTAGSEALSLEESIDEKPNEGDDPAAALALRTVEILRARLIGAALTKDHTTPPPAPSSAPPAPTTTPAPAPRPSPPANSALPASPNKESQSIQPITHNKSSNLSTSLYIAPSLILHPGSSLSIGGGTLGGISHRITPLFSGDFMVIAPVAPSTIQSSAGTIKIRSTSIGIGGWLHALGVPPPFELGAGAGLSLSFLAFDGEASDPIFQGRDGTVPYALPYARAFAAYRALPRLAVRADVLGGMAIPRPVIQSDANAESTVFGRPLLLLSLGLETAFF